MFQYGWRLLAVHFPDIMSKLFLNNRSIPVIVSSTLRFWLWNLFGDKNILFLLVAMQFSYMGSYLTCTYSSLLSYWSFTALTSLGMSGTSQHWYLYAGRELQQRLFNTGCLATLCLMFTCTMKVFFLVSFVFQMGVVMSHLKYILIFGDIPNLDSIKLKLLNIFLKSVLDSPSTVWSLYTV